MNIVFAASECHPFVKTGGLADVMGSLPGAIAALKSGAPKTVVQFIPKYSQINPCFKLEALSGHFLIPMSGRLEVARVWALSNPNKNPAKTSVKTYFIENEKYFNRPALYQDQLGEYPDNDQRFIFFSRAVLECCKWIDFVPDIIHCHDWQTGLIPAYLKTVYLTDAFFRRTKSVFTIHNAAYQGIFPVTAVSLANLRWQDFTPEGFEYYGDISFLKSGIVYADKVTTVSPNYAKEIQTDPYKGRGMEGILKARTADFFGIVNGLDLEFWNPAKDPFLEAPYSSKQKTWPKKKQLCKNNLQKYLNLPAEESSFVIGMVSRLDYQKGFNHLFELIPEIKQKCPMVQWAVMGLGDSEIQIKLEKLAKKFPKNVAVNFKFNEELAHKIYGGSDIFFMPSEFEPCGLGQLIAMRYGTIPLVTPTGGLLDTVIPWTLGVKRGTGFVSADILTSSIFDSLELAIETYNRREDWLKLCENAMEKKSSWERSAEEYIKIYRQALQNKN